MIETITQHAITSQLQSDVHTAFLHANVDQELFAEPPESDEGYESELREDEVWKLNRALSGYHTAPKCGIRML